MRPLLLLALLAGVPGCLQDAADTSKETGCASMHMLTVTEEAAPAGAVVVAADTGGLLGFSVGIIQLSDHLATLPPEERSTWQTIGYQVRQSQSVPSATEFLLSPLEWVGLAMILDDGAVAQGAASVGPVEDAGSYRFHVAHGERTLRFDLDVAYC